MRKYLKFQRGNAWIGFLLLLIFVSVLSLSLINSMVVTLSQSRRSEQAAVSQAIADAGIDKALWKLNKTAGLYTGETNTDMTTGVLDITVTNIDANNKSVLATSYIPSKTSPKEVRKVRAKISAESSSDTVSFHYGIQTGPNGITMSNNSYVNGNVYSKGTLTGANNANIYGDVIMSGSTGKIQNITICTGNNATNPTSCDTSKTSRVAKAHTITGSTIYGDAYYISISGSTVKRNSYPSSPDPADQNFPIDTATISDWETAAATGGTVNGYSLTNGASGSLGPKKINGDLTLSNNANLTVTGIIWVTGQINISNSSIVRLDPAVYAQNSGMIVADNPADRTTGGAINLANGIHICGAVTLTQCQNDSIPAGNKSYLMLLSTKTSGTAISVGNGGHAVVYYATDGNISISNNSHVRALTGGGLTLSNNAGIDYDSGLANAEFSTGPGGSWVIKEWQVVN
jgi:hypothetical protein